MSINPQRSVVSQLKQILVDLKEAWPRIQTEVSTRKPDSVSDICFKTRFAIAAYDRVDFRGSHDWIEIVAVDTLSRLIQMSDLWRLEEGKKMVFQTEALSIKLNDAILPAVIMGIEVKYSISAIQIALTTDRDGSTLVGLMASMLPNATNKGIQFCELMIAELESHPF